MFNQFNQYQRYQQPMYQPNYNQMSQMYAQPIYQPAGINGRIVDNIEVVKATEISLDGSVNYFPIADGSAIVTKQLQADGTSKIMVYKPVANETPQYITGDDFENEMTNLKQEIEEIKNKIIQLEGVGVNEKSSTNGNEFFSYKSKSKSNT